MALVLKDRVKEQTTTTGTGTITLDGTVSGFESFASVGDGNTTYYAIVSQSADEWEVGLGTYTAAGTLLSRDTILESSNSDAAVNFSAGTKDVFVTYPSDKAVYADAAGEVSVTRATSATFAASATFATSATNATTAVSATNATSATFATSATNATNQNGGTVSATSGTFNTLIANGLTYPSTDGTASQIIETNGSGTLSFVSVSGGATDINGLSDAAASGTSSLYLGTDVGNGNTSQNTGVGQQSLQNLDATAYGNTAVGTSSGKAITTGLQNTCIGWDAGEVVTTAFYNVLVGAGAAKSLTTGANNVVIGGTEAAENLSTGSGNTVIGYKAGRATATNSNCIILGQSAASSSNSVANEITLGNSSITSFRIPGVNFYSLNGNVGIGTSSPTQALEVAGTIRSSISSALSSYIATTSGGGGFFIEPDDYSAANPVWEIKTYASEPLAFQMGGTERMRIESSGNVGIGNAAPSYLLDLYKSASTVARVRNTAATGGTPSTTHGEFVIESTDANMGMQFLGSTSADQRILFSDTGANSGQIVYNHTSNYMALSTAAAERVRIDSSGNVGIGVSTVDTALGTKLHVAGTIRTDTGSANANPAIVFDHDNFGDADANYIMLDRTNEAMRFNVNASERMRIDSSGNVGIGTTSPAKQFEITKASRALIGTLTDGATITPDFDANQNFTVTLGGNRTLANPTNVDAGQTGSIFVVQDATGGRTLSFGANWKFAGGTAPTLSTGANAVDRIDYIVKSSTEIHAVATLNLS